MASSDEHYIQQQREEHAHISNVAGKKVFNIDSDGNVINYSGVTVYQGSQPWNSLGTVTLAANDVTLESGVTVFQGSAPWTGEATIYDANNSLAIARGDVSGHSLVHKFGAAPDFDTGDNEVTIWDGADDGGVDQMTYTYSTTAAIDSISSANAGDLQDIEVQGLDTDYKILTQTATLSGTSLVSLATPFIRVFRAKNSGASTLLGDVYVYENDTTTAGAPDDATLNRAVIQSENNQTEMAIYTVPAGKSAYLTGFYVSIGGASRTAEYLFKLRARPFGGVFQLKHKFAIDDSVSTNYHHIYTDPQKFSEKTDLEMTCDLLTGSITAANVIAGFDLVLVDN